MANIVELEQKRQEALNIHNNNLALGEALRSVTDDVELYNKNSALYKAVNPTSSVVFIDHTAKNFGTSRFDNRVKALSDFTSTLNDLRANEQSTIGKWTNATIKTGIQTFTTAANTTVGLLSGLYSAVFGNSEGERGTTGFVNNPVSKALMQLEDWSEDTFANYRSDWEQNAKWWQRMGTANFWADDIMKNLGFSMGSVLAAGLAVRGIQTAMRGITKKAYREAFETIGKSFNKRLAGSEIKKILKEEGEKIAKMGMQKSAAIDRIRSLSKTEDLVSTMTGSALGAVGEAQYEAITAVDEFKKTNKENLDNWFQINDDYLRKMYDKNNHRAANGEIVTFDEFKKIKYDEAVKAIDEQANKVGNTVFAFESALLALTNANTFKRFFTGGYRNFNPAVYKNSFHIGKAEVSEVAKNIGTKKSENGLLEAFNKLSKAKKIKKVITPLITEGPVEEMGQNFINKAGEFYHGSYLNEQLDYVLNKDYNEEAASIFNSVIEGFARSYGNKEEWMDGFAGALFGALGILTIRRTKSDGSKKRIPIGLEGGVAEQWREIQDTEKLINETVAQVNSFLQSPEQIEKFQSVVRQIAIQHDMDVSIFNRDQLTFKDKEQEMLMNTIAAFRNAGMDHVLDSYIESATTNLTKDQIDELRPNLAPNLQQKSDSEIKAYLQKESNEVKKLIDQYRKINDSVALSFGSSFSPRQIDMMSGLLSLANYKYDRARDIIKEYRDELPISENDSKMIENLVDFLELNDPVFDNWEELNDATRQSAIERIIRTIANKFPNSWDVLKQQKAIDDLFDAYRNIQGSIALNNEFALYANNPAYMTKLFEQKFNDHLTDEELKTVDETLELFKNAKTKDEVKSLYEKLGDDKTSEKIKTLLQKDENSTQIIKDALLELKQESFKKSLLSEVSKQGLDLEASGKLSTGFTKNLISQLERLPVLSLDAYVQYLIDTHNYTNEEFDFLDKILDYLVAVNRFLNPTSSNVTQPSSQTTTSSTNSVTQQQATQQNTSREEAIKKLMLDPKISKIILDAIQQETDLVCSINKDGMVCMPRHSLLEGNYEIKSNIVIDLTKNRAILGVEVINIKNNKSDNAAYEITRNFSFAKVTKYTKLQLDDLEPMVISLLSSLNEDVRIEDNDGTISKKIIANTITKFPITKEVLKALIGTEAEPLIQYLDPDGIITSPQSESQSTTTNSNELSVQQVVDSAQLEVNNTYKQLSLLQEHVEVIRSIDIQTTYKNILTEIKSILDDLNQTLQNGKFKTAVENRQTNPSDLNDIETKMERCDTLLDQANSIWSEYNNKVVSPSKPTTNTSQNQPDLEQQRQQLLTELQNKEFPKTTTIVTEYGLPHTDPQTGLRVNQKEDLSFLDNTGSGRWIDGKYNIDKTIRQLYIDREIYRNIYDTAINDYLQIVPVSIYTLFGNKTIPTSFMEWLGKYGIGDPSQIVFLIQNNSDNTDIGIILPDHPAYRYLQFLNNNNFALPDVKISDKWISNSEFRTPTDELHNLHFEQNDVLCYSDYKGNIYLWTNNDITLTNEQISLIKYQLKTDNNGEKSAILRNPGVVYALRHKGDHFKIHETNEGERVAFYPDALHLNNFATLFDGINSFLERHTPTKVLFQKMNMAKQTLNFEDVNAVLKTWYQINHNSVSYLEITKQNDVHSLVAQLNHWEGNVIVHDETRELCNITDLNETTFAKIVMQTGEYSQALADVDGVCPAISLETLDLDSDLNHWMWDDNTSVFSTYLPETYAYNCAIEVDWSNLTKTNNTRKQSSPMIEAVVEDLSNENNQQAIVPSNTPVKESETTEDDLKRSILDIRNTIKNNFMATLSPKEKSIFEQLLIPTSTYTEYLMQSSAVSIFNPTIMPNLMQKTIQYLTNLVDWQNFQSITGLNVNDANATLNNTTLWLCLSCDVNQDNFSERVTKAFECKQ